MRLIDADALIKQIDTEREILAMNGNLGAEHILVHYVRNFIKDAPTVDAVEVVRCKDCAHTYLSDCFGMSDLWRVCRKHLGKRVQDYDFCSWGEKKE